MKVLWGVLAWAGLVACGVPVPEEESVQPVTEESVEVSARSADSAHRPRPPTEPEWVRTISGSGEHETQAVAHDPRGNVFVLVTDLGGPLDFGTGPMSAPFPVGRIAGLAKYSPGGRLLWAHVITAQPTEEIPVPSLLGIAMATDPKGNLVLSVNVTGRLALGAIDVSSGDYLVKLDGDGHGLWARRLPTRATDVAIDDDGHIGITGFLQGAPGATFDFGNGPITAAKPFAFVARYSSRGKLDWVFVDDEVIFTEALATDEHGNFYFGGIRFPDIQSGVGTPYLRKVTCKGQGAWSRLLEGSTGGILSIAAHHDRVVAVGSFSGSFRFAGRTHTSAPSVLAEGFLLNFSQSGRERWAQQLDSPLFAVGLDHEGGVYVAGEIGSDGPDDWLFTARYFKESGNRDWALSFRDRFLFARDLSVTPRGDLAITGPSIYVLQFAR
ncbi:hypothetical protein [Archangium sp.]|uniref:hypothetical protein n=1 Tax=Archangium sp. TaxID=1872627 RepID=UPI00389A2530